MTDVDIQKTELELLKEQATLAGLSFKPNATVKALKKLLAEQYREDSVSEENQARFDLEAENLKLIKVIITPNDANKRLQTGEIFCAGNSMLGTIKRYVPFGQEWLIENMLLKSIQEREYQLLIPRKTEKDEEFVESKLLPAYQIQILPNPTKEEIEQLAKLQEARQSVE